MCTVHCVARCYCNDDVQHLRRELLRCGAALRNAVEVAAVEGGERRLLAVQQSLKESAEFLQYCGYPTLAARVEYLDLSQLPEKSGPRRCSLTSLAHNPTDNPLLLAVEGIIAAID